MSGSQPPAVRPAESAAMRKRAVVSLLFVLTACLSSTEPESIYGTYDLQTIAGQPLPYVLFQSGADKMELTAGHQRLNSDMTYSSSATLRVTESGAVEIWPGTTAGTYTVNGSSLTFTPSDHDLEPYTGSLFDKTLTIIEEGLAFVFVKP